VSKDSSWLKYSDDSNSGEENSQKSLKVPPILVWEPNGMPASVKEEEEEWSSSPIVAGSVPSPNISPSSTSEPHSPGTIQLENNT